MELGGTIHIWIGQRTVQSYIRDLYKFSALDLTLCMSLDIYRFVLVWPVYCV